MPMIANIASVVLNAALSFILAKYVGVLGVSLATSLSVILTICLLNKSIKKYIPDFRFSSMYKLLIKLAIACIITVLFTLGLKNIVNTPLIIEFVICALGALGVYAVSLFALRCEELNQLLSQMKSQILNKLKK